MSDNREVLHILLRARQSLIMRYVVRSQGELRADVIFFELHSTRLSSSQTKYDFFFFTPPERDLLPLLTSFHPVKYNRCV